MRGWYYNWDIDTGTFKLRNLPSTTRMLHASGWAGSQQSAHLLSMTTAAGEEQQAFTKCAPKTRAKKFKTAVELKLVQANQRASLATELFPQKASIHPEP